MPSYNNGNKFAFKHGHSWPQTPTYVAWRNMIERCKPKHKNHKDYADRGIKVCKRWSKFENFLADMGEKPHGELTLERKNNNRGYSPNNCTWASYIDNANNRRNKRRN